MELPTDLFKIVKSFLLLTKNDFNCKKCFLEHIKTASLNDIKKILHKLSINKITINNMNLSINSFITNTEIPSNQRRIFLSKFIINHIKNNCNLMKQIGFFTRCVPNLENIFNWSYNFNPGVIVSTQQLIYKHDLPGIARLKARVYKRYYDRIFIEFFDYIIHDEPLEDFNIVYNIEFLNNIDPKKPALIVKYIEMSIWDSKPTTIIINENDSLFNFSKFISAMDVPV
jgi:hypothetical protein